MRGNGTRNMESNLLLFTSCTEAAAKWKVDLGRRRDRFIITTYQPGLNLIPSIPFSLALVDMVASSRLHHTLNICRQLRRQSTNPILLLTPEEDESQFLAAYRIGVDDCIPTPINTDLLMAKVQAWLRFARHHPRRPLLRHRALALASPLPYH